MSSYFLKSPDVRGGRQFLAIGQKSSDKMGGNKPIAILY
jgi:hypothetical protein